MSLHFSGCTNPAPMESCDLETKDRSTLCTACLTYLIRRERPEGWSPRVPKPPSAN
jgi:hypothetical protein